ncbi:DUF397 domain-containing protein [Streptomyces sp. p1417]|uniref:DUF397 domain-containing protein n=1 Tax=Streptomyces typhae TaxID=2681492 RepID=A0A6L6WNT8_9ACTN|nr:DUF397 domain-containing protein [Streptomyces typhae]MVO83640.1 DUF397 domain-containing protein [Streptomyces typhae]
MTAQLMWLKSSYSSTGGGECIEVAACTHSIRVRDSKLGSRSPQLRLPADAWARFVAYARS